MYSLKKDLFKIRVEKGKSRLLPESIYTNVYNCMPPSFLVDRYMITDVRQQAGSSTSKGLTFNGIMTDADVFIDINWDLYRRLMKGWKQNEPEYYDDYVKWPIRFSFTCKSARENDRKLKIQKWPAYHAELVKLFGYEWKSKTLEYALGWVEEAKKYLKYDDWTKSYVAAHEEAHPVRGVSWGQLLKYGKMDTLFEFTKEFVDWWVENFNNPGDWSLSQSTTDRKSVV